MNKQEILNKIEQDGFSDELALEVSIIDRKILEYKKYLSDTDWYYARKLETGEDIPEDVVVKRAEARDFIRNNEDI